MVLNTRVANEHETLRLDSERQRVVHLHFSWFSLQRLLVKTDSSKRQTINALNRFYMTSRLSIFSAVIYFIYF